MYSDASPSAICVQQFDDSLDPAIHMTYRISLRSSSLREPRDPSLMTVGFIWSLTVYLCRHLHERTL